MAAFLALLLLQVSVARTYRVVLISGYQEVAAFIAQVAPEEPVFFDGLSDGIFTFYTRAGDAGLRQRVVLGSKLCIPLRSSRDGNNKSSYTRQKRSLKCCVSEAGVVGLSSK